MSQGQQHKINITQESRTEDQKAKKTCSNITLTATTFEKKEECFAPLDYAPSIVYAPSML